MGANRGFGANGGLRERGDILRFTRQGSFRFRVRIHHYFRTRVGGNAAGKSDRQQTDHCDFKPSIHRETVPYLQTEEFSSRGRREDFMVRESKQMKHHDYQ